MTTAALPSAAVAFYAHKRDEVPEVKTLSWEEVKALLLEHDFTDCSPCPGGKCDKKNGLAFSPGVPRSGTTRANENTEFVSLLVFDRDHCSRVELQALCDRLRGLECIVSSTHSHQHGGLDDCCVRIILVPSRPLRADEFRPVYRALNEHFQIGADPQTKDLSRLYFLPSAPTGSDVIEVHGEGTVINVDEVLEVVGRDAPTWNSEIVLPPIESIVGPRATADMEALRQCLRDYNKAENPDEGTPKKELARRVAESAPLTTPEEQRVRHNTCLRIGKVLAHTLPKGTSQETMLELVRQSVVTMPAFEGDGPRENWCESAFAQIISSWNDGLKSRAANDLQVAQMKADGAKAQKVLTNMFGRWEKKRNSSAKISISRVKPEEDSKPVEDDAYFAGWETELITIPKKDGGFANANVDFNAKLILTAAPEWRGVLRYNIVTKNVDVIGGPLDEYETTPTQIVTGVKCWLQKNYRVNLRSGDVMACILIVAQRNAFDPLQDYLNGVKWEGDYADTFLEDYCNVTTTNVNGADIREFIQKFSRRWLVGSVARALDPGCKMDTVLIFEGKTGLFKSTALKVLGGEFFSDSKIVIGTNEAMMLAGTNWIHEIAELTSFHASDTEAQKAFFSSATDMFRAPYARAPEKHPRRCSFVGSTNDDRYLNDPTGNRRYWPVKSEGHFKIKKLRQDRDKIWGDAVAIYKAAFTCPDCDLPDRCEEHRWWMDEEENRELEKINQHRLKAGGFSDAIIDWFLKKPKDLRPKKLTSYDVAIDILKLPIEKVENQLRVIGRTLKAIGFDRDRETTEHGIRVRYYSTPVDLVDAEVRESRLRLVSSNPNPRPSAPTQPTPAAKQ